VHGNGIPDGNGTKNLISHGSGNGNGNHKLCRWEWEWSLSYGKLGIPFPWTIEREPCSAAKALLYRLSNPVYFILVSPWARPPIFRYWYHLSWQMPNATNVFWKFNSHKSSNHLIAMQYSQLSGSNCLPNVHHVCPRSVTKKWGRGNIKSNYSGTNHRIAANYPSELSSEWILNTTILYVFNANWFHKWVKRGQRSQNLGHTQNLDSPFLSRMRDIDIPILSVCLSVRPWHAGIVWKRLKISS